MCNVNYPFITHSYLSVCLFPGPCVKSVLRMGAVMGEGALDGGRGWIIVLVSFMAQFLSFGSPQSVGVLYPEWLIAFQEGKGKTAWVGSMVSGVALITSEYLLFIRTWVCLCVRNS